MPLRLTRLVFGLVSICLGISAFAADPQATSVLTADSFFDRVKMVYWGNYCGPQLSSLSSGYTTNAFGDPHTQQQWADDLLTVGYQLAPGFRPGIGVPFNLYPSIQTGIDVKPLYFGIIDAKIVQLGDLSIHTDLRIYTPLGGVAQRQDVKTGFRSSQITLYHVAGTPLTLGAYNYVRVWAYGEHGTGFRNDFELYFSPFMNYRLFSGLYATVWSDWLQLGHQYGTPWKLTNLPVDVQPGIRWDITPKININPYLNFIPAHLDLSLVNLGMVVNATLL